ncbi:MAG TPA: hypothetical protein V6C88_02745 [Chroococcidiopsis sp.]
MLKRYKRRSPRAIGDMGYLRPTAPANHPLQTPYATAIAAKGWMPSKQLDLWSLALCSCVLTLLCHSIATPPQTTNVSSSRAIAPSNAGMSTSPASQLMFKLFTMPGQRPEIEDDEAEPG